MQGKPPEMQGFSVSSEPLKSLGKEGKNTQKSKEFLKNQKSKEIQKSKERRSGPEGFRLEGGVGVPARGVLRPVRENKWHFQ